MATSAGQPLKFSAPASVDLAALTDRGQFRFVKIAGTTSSSHFAPGQLVLAQPGDHNILGVSQSKPTAVGQMVEVVVLGFTKVVAGTAITEGAPLGPDSNGAAQAVTVTGSTYTKSAVGILANSGVDAANNDIVRALVNCPTGLAGT